MSSSLAALNKLPMALAISGLESIGCPSLLWEQEAAGSNPAIPTKPAGRRLASGRPKGFQDRLTVI